MSRYVRTAQIRSLTIPLRLESADDFEFDDFLGTEFPVNVSGIMPILLAILAIVSLTVLWLSVRPQANPVQIDALGSRAEPASLSTTRITESVVAESSALSDHQPSESQSGLTTPSVLSPIFTPEVLYWSDEIVKWSVMYDVDPNVIATIMQIESCGNPQAKSYAGAQGLFQVMPFHFAPGEDMLDPDTNAMRGIAFFKEQMRYTGGDTGLSFAGYNGGYAASGGAYANWPAETQRYFYWAKGIYEAASAGESASTTLNEWLAAGGAGGCQGAATNLGI